MADKNKPKKIEGDFSSVSYVLGIISIVLAFFQPLAGLILGIVGVVQSKKEKTELSNRAKKLNVVGIILSVILFIVSILVAIYLIPTGISNLKNFPIA